MPQHRLLRNFEQGAVTGQRRIPIDYEHASTETGAVGADKLAAGWIVWLRFDPPRVLARVEWTPRAKQAISDGEFAYLSPTFVGSYRDERGKDPGPSILGAGARQ